MKRKLLLAALAIFLFVGFTQAASPHSKPTYAVVNRDGEEIWRFCHFAADYLACGSSGEVALLRNGDRVQILSGKTRAADGWDIYKVQFHQWVGWINATDVILER